MLLSNKDYKTASAACMCIYHINDEILSFGTFIFQIFYNKYALILSKIKQCNIVLTIHIKFILSNKDMHIVLFPVTPTTESSSLVDFIFKTFH